MPKNKEQAKASAPDSLIKTTQKKRGAELTEQDLDKITAGRKAGKGQQEF
jgi:hypothetical protein